jgi:glycosyltransferase involved in cell wall biosynthesis
MTAIPFTIGIPVYNEEEILVENTLRLREFLQQFQTPFEILLGSNGSTDRTVELGKQLAIDHAGIRLFHLPQRGVGQVFQRFVHEARYDRLVSLDMDLSIDLNFVSEALHLLDEYDIVVGSKKMGTQDRSWMRLFASLLFVNCAKWLLGINYADYSIAAKAYRRPVLKHYQDLIKNGTAYVIDMVYYVQRDGGRVIQIPVHCEDHRSSKFNLIQEGLYKFANLARLWWNRNKVIQKRSPQGD